VKRSNSTLALIAVIAASAFGYILARGIPSAVFPEITFRRATILADSGDLPADQMLATVTRPLEEAAYSVPGVTLVRSTTTRGASEIDVTFGEDADPQMSFQNLNAAVGHVRSRLPPDTSVDAVLLTTGTFPIIDVSLSSQTRSLPELTDIANYDLVPSLHRIEGTYRVEVVGGKLREYVVRIDPDRMLQHNLSATDVVTGLQKNNVVASAGRMNESHRMLLTVVTADLHQADQIATLPIATMGNQPVRVSDIGNVELGIQEDYIRTESENGPAVLIGISRRPGGNTVQIAEEARRTVEEFRGRYPDVKFSFSYDQSDLVTESFNSVRDAILLGLVLAVLVVLAFTMSPLSAIVAAIVVPCTVAITCVVMKAAGLTFNMMTLGGLAAGIGLFIDDAIVMIEAIHRELAAGESTATAVSAALANLGKPLFASTMTVIVVFGPLVFLSGVTGVFSRSLAATLGGGLAISLVLAIYFTPAIELAIGRFRRKAREPGRFYHAIQSSYLFTLRPFIRLPILSIAVAIASVAVGYLVYNNLGTDYLPPLDEGAFILDYITPPQSTLEDTTALLRRIEDVLKSTPEVVSFSRRTGTQLGFFLTESNRGDMSVRVKRDRTRDIDAIINSIRSRVLESVPGVEIEFAQILQDMIGDLSDTPQPIEVKVFGSDRAAIEATAIQVAQRMRGIHGVVDVFNGIVTSIPEQEVVIDKTQAARYGLTADDIRSSLNAVVQGTVATNVLAGDRLIDVRVRYPDAFREDNATLSEVMLKSPSNARVPLSSVTKINYVGERNEIARERQRSLVRVTARLEDVDLGTAVAAVKANLAKMPLPAGMSLEYGGLYADQQQAFHQLTLVLVAGTLIMFLILVWEFARIAPAIACLVAAVACLAGSFIGLDLTGMTLNISSFMGIIMVAGITAKNGILLLDHAEREVDGGAEPRVALFEAAQLRLRPIIMTTVATAAGLLPLALGYGAGAKVQQPLAIAVIGGLAFAMILSTPLAGGIYLLGTRRRRSSDRAEPLPVNS
jgi:CzcA family heavy metal efflux pump